MKSRERWRFSRLRTLPTSPGRKFLWTVASGKSEGVRRGRYLVRASLVSACRRIGSGGGVDVEEPGVGVVAGHVTIAVGVRRGGTTRGEFLAARRLRELPDGGVANFAGGGRRRISRHGASRRGRTGIVVNPKNEIAPLQLVANVVRGDDRDAPAFVHRHTSAIHS